MSVKWILQLARPHFPAGGHPRCRHTGHFSLFMFQFYLMHVVHLCLFGRWRPIPFATLLTGDPAAFTAQARMPLAAAFALPQLPDRAPLLPLKLSRTTLGKFGRDQLLFRHLPEPRLPAASAWVPASVLSPRSRRPGARAAGADARIATTYSSLLTSNLSQPQKV